MDFGKLFITRTDFEHIQSSSAPRNIIAEVVLLDKSVDSCVPVLYQLKKDMPADLRDLRALRRDFMAMKRDAFILIGEVLSIDKKLKQVILSDQNTVAYTHLIVSTGEKYAPASSNEDEFAVGLQALIDALRMRSPAICALLSANACNNPASASSKTPQISTRDIPQASTQEQDVEKIAQPTLQKELNASFGLDLSATSKRVYEVQV